MSLHTADRLLPSLSMAALLDKARPITPCMGATYYWVDGCGDVIPGIWKDDFEDACRLAVDNVFDDVRRAERRATARKVAGELTQFSWLAPKSDHHWCITFDACGEPVVHHCYDPRQERLPVAGVWFDSRLNASLVFKAVTPERLKIWHADFLRLPMEETVHE